MTRSPVNFTKDIEYPDLWVEVSQSLFLSGWSAQEALTRFGEMALERYPEVVISFSVNRGTTKHAPVHVTVMNVTNSDGMVLKQVDANVAKLTAPLAEATYDIIADCEQRAHALFRARLDRASSILAEFERRPVVLSEFLVEIGDLHAMLVETDFAMLMAEDYFRSKAANESSTFSRSTMLHPGASGIPFELMRTNDEFAGRLSLGGRDRILRNRSLIVFLYELWDHHYRPEIAAVLGRPAREIISPVFGDLRQFRNDIAHHASILQRQCTALNLVRPGESIDLISQMDRLFEIVVGELNRLATVYFGAIQNSPF